MQAIRWRVVSAPHRVWWTRWHAAGTLGWAVTACGLPLPESAAAELTREEREPERFLADPLTCVTCRRIVRRQQRQSKGGKA